MSLVTKNMLNRKILKNETPNSVIGLATFSKLDLL